MPEILLNDALKLDRGLSIPGLAVRGGGQMSWARDAYHAWDFLNDQARFAGVYKGPLANTPNWTFTRASTAYYTNSAGVLTSVASGVLRTGDRGALIEGAGTNLCLQSEDFSTTWTNTASTESVNTATAPNGLLTADKLIEDATAASTHRLFQSITTTAAAHCFSVYAKAGERSWIYLRFNNSVPESCYAWFNLATGVVGSVSGTGATGSIESIGNGWYRCVLKIATANNASNTVVIGLTTADAVSDYNGDGASGLYLWGAQLEAASFPSSYIPTTTASATRAADALSVTSVTGLDYPLTLFAEFERAVDTGGTEVIFATNVVGDANRAQLSVSSADLLRYQTVSGGVGDGDQTVATAIPIGAVQKAAFRTTTNDVRGARNGTLGNQDAATTAIAAAPTRIEFGTLNSAAPLFGYLRRTAIRLGALDDAGLQAWTA